MKKITASLEAKYVIKDVRQPKMAMKVFFGAQSITTSCEVPLVLGWLTAVAWGLHPARSCQSVGVSRSK